MKRKITRALAVILMVCMLLPQTVFAANNKTYNLILTFSDSGENATEEVVTGTVRYLTGKESLSYTIAGKLLEDEFRTYASPAMREKLREGVEAGLMRDQAMWNHFVTVTMEGATGDLLESVSNVRLPVSALEVNKVYTMNYVNAVEGDPKEGVLYTLAVQLVPYNATRGFKDVPATYWAYNEIMWAYGNGYMNGVSADTFNPAGNVTRQQVWMILARHSGTKPANMAEAKAWAVENGISDGSNPGNPVTRQQLVALLYRYADMRGYNVSARAELAEFPDYSSVSDYAKAPMGWSVANGIVTGTAQGTLNPQGNATRAQFAVIMYRFCEEVVV